MALHELTGRVPGHMLMRAANAAESGVVPILCKYMPAVDLASRSSPQLPAKQPVTSRFQLQHTNITPPSPALRHMLSPSSLSLSLPQSAATQSSSIPSISVKAWHSRIKSALPGPSTGAELYGAYGSPKTADTPAVATSAELRLELWCEVEPFERVPGRGCPSPKH